VRLNRRLAPAIYQRVVPVTRSGDGLRFGGEGEAIEWAVQLVGGLPGFGKSTLARGLAERTPFQVLRSDGVRKELAEGADVSLESCTTTNIYTPEGTAKTYAECLRRTEELLFAGERVLVDATFREERWRQAFLAAAARWTVPAVLLLCRASPDIVRAAGSPTPRYIRCRLVGLSIPGSKPGR
jgi:predicted kinase